MVNIFAFCAIEGSLHGVCKQSSKQGKHDRPHEDPGYSKRTPEEGLWSFVTVSNQKNKIVKIHISSF